MKIKLRLLPIVVIAAAGLAACGSSTSTAKDDPAPPAAPATVASAKGPKLKIVSSDYGQILASGRGRALYLFTADTGKASNCSGDCATAWPPYIVKSKPVAGPGARSRLIGTTRRS